MTQASPDWIAEKTAAEQEQIVRFDGLTALALRVDGYIRRAEESATALGQMPNADPTARLQEADDLRRCVQLVTFFAGNLDRVHLIEQPSRRETSAFGRRRAAR
jgi:hypothetical protein